MIVKIFRRETPYVQMDKSIVEDTRLSWKAKGMMAYLLSRPESWTVVSEDITKRSTDGKESVLAGMNELREFGYAHLKFERDEKGMMTGKFWAVFETPTPPDEFTILPKTAKPEDRETRPAGKPSDGKPVPSNKEGSKKELFKPPTLEELKSYAKEIGLPESDGEHLFNHWTDNKWTRGNKPLSDWRAAFRTWKSGGHLPSQRNHRNGSGFNGHSKPAVITPKTRLV